MTDFVTILSGSFCVIGLGLSIMSVRHFVRRLEFIRCSHVATGEVVALTEEHDGLETTHFSYPKIRFQTNSGRRITFESRMGLSGSSWQIGESVSVRYPQDQPEAVEIDSFVSLWLPTVVFAFLGAVFLLVGAAVWLGLIPL